MQFTIPLMEKLSQFELEVTHEDFAKCFGETLGYHLLGKFCNEYNYSIIRLYQNLSPQNKEKLVAYINKLS